jgi:thiol-disulfide isomerase/thioredoxin
VALADFNRGPLLVNFWATSCAPCVRELPALTALHRELQPKGFEILAIAMPYDPPARVLDFQQRFAIPYMIALDLDGGSVRTFTPPAIPYSVLIAPGGHVVWQKLGELDIPALRAELLLLIEEKR